MLSKRQRRNGLRQQRNVRTGQRLLKWELKEGTLMEEKQVIIT